MMGKKLSTREEQAIDWLKNEIEKDRADLNKEKQRFIESLKNFKKENHYGIDYNFFISVLYPLIGNDKIVHDEFFEKCNFPSKRIGYQFVGEVFDEHNQTVQAHVDGLKAAIL